MGISLLFIRSICWGLDTFSCLGAWPALESVLVQKSDDCSIRVINQNPFTRKDFNYKKSEISFKLIVFRSYLNALNVCNFLAFIGQTISDQLQVLVYSHNWINYPIWLALKSTSHYHVLFMIFCLMEE